MARSRNTADTQTASGGPVSPSIAGKNAVINGDFSINQRNFSSSTTDLAFLFDRWRHTYSGASLTSTAQTFAVGNAITGYEPKNYLQSVTASQTTTTYAAILYAGIEDVRVLAGQTATISFWAKAASGTPAVGIEIQQNFGSGGSAAVTTAVVAKTLSTSWARYTATIAVPSITGKTIGTGSNLGLNLWLSAGATSGVASRASDIGAQNATFQFWGVQVEAGSVATPFQTATGTIQGELAACQRYYYRLTPGQNETIYGGAIAQSTTGATAFINNPVPMRTIATSIDFSTLALLLPAIAFYAASSMTIKTEGCSTNVTTVQFAASGLTTSRYYFLTNNGTNVGYLGFSAEL